MGKTSRLYSPEFEEEAIRLVQSCEEKYPVAKVARDLDVSAEALRKWVNQAEIDAGERDGLTGERRAAPPAQRGEGPQGGKSRGSSRHGQPLFKA